MNKDWTFWYSWNRCINIKADHWEYMTANMDSIEWERLEDRVDSWLYEYAQDGEIRGTWLELKKFAEGLAK